MGIRRWRNQYKERAEWKRIGSLRRLKSIVGCNAGKRRRKSS
jgi:hypothetical protein